MKKYQALAFRNLSAEINLAKVSKELRKAIIKNEATISKLATELQEQSKAMADRLFKEREAERDEVVKLRQEYAKDKSEAILAKLLEHKAFFEAEAEWQNAVNDFYNEDYEAEIETVDEDEFMDALSSADIVLRANDYTSIECFFKAEN
jgi:thioesterase domain-containing protein